ncbi:MAG: mechanosensitive ion channel family protein [Pseudomonadota bacterium]
MSSFNEFWRRVGALLLLVAVLGVGTPSLLLAQTSDDGVSDEEISNLPEHLTRDDVRDLMSRLSDDQVRELLIQQLDKVADDEAAASIDANAVDSFERGLGRLRDGSVAMVEALPRVPTIFGFTIDHMTAGKGASHVWKVLVFLAIILVAGAIGEWLFRRLFTRLSQFAHAGEVETVVQRLCVFLLRAVIDLVAIAVFGIVAVIVFFIFYQNHEPTREAMAAVFWAVIVVRAIKAVARDFFCPDQPAIRAIALSDTIATWAYRRLIWIAGVIVAVWYFGTLLVSYGINSDPGLAHATAAVLTLAVLGWVVVLVWIDRRTVRGFMLSDDGVEEAEPSQARAFLASNWHVLATCYILGLWLFTMVERLLTGQPQGVPAVISLALLPIVPMIDWLLRAGIRRLCEGAKKPEPGMPDDVDIAEAPGMSDAEAPDGMTVETIEPRVQQPAADTAGRAIEPVLIRNMRIVLAIMAIIFLADLWGLDLESFLVAGLGQRIAGAFFDIVVTLILASAIWGMVKATIKHYAPDDGIDVQQMVEGEIGGAGQSRIQTLLPLLRKFALVTLGVIVTLVILSSLGVSIGPLIAGAGVVGLAIGFGAQTLVRDILSGAFFLADDAFRVGEYIDVGVAKGMVEKISIRSFRLRHHRGAINTIPFGEIHSVMNFSRDWVMMKLEMRVPSDTDLEKLRKVVKKVGQQIMDDPELGAHLLQPVKSQGVHRMDDDGAFVIRIKFMAKPGEQFVLRREVFRRVQEAFAANDIKFAPKRVMVDTHGQAADADVAAAAVAAETSRS